MDGKVRWRETRPNSNMSHAATTGGSAARNRRRMPGLKRMKDSPGSNFSSSPTIRLSLNVWFSDHAYIKDSWTGQYLSSGAPCDNLPGFEAKRIGRSAVNYCASAIYFPRLTEKAWRDCEEESSKTQQLHYGDFCHQKHFLWTLPGDHKCRLWLAHNNTVLSGPLTVSAFLPFSLTSTSQFICKFPLP